MSIPDLQLTAIRCETAEGWTVVVVEFQWLDAYYGRASGMTRLQLPRGP